eukprot:m.67767 g.67767  ORF g.67767 m.67767 type:complete len:750 (-) comp12171_c1_seq1:140-2389(-)
MSTQDELESQGEEDFEDFDAFDGEEFDADMDDGGSKGGSEQAGSAIALCDSCNEDVEESDRFVCAVCEGTFHIKCCVHKSIDWAEQTCELCSSVLPAEFLYQTLPSDVYSELVWGAMSKVGVIFEEGQVPRPFRPWAELVQALDRLLETMLKFNRGEQPHRLAPDKPLSSEGASETEQAPDSVTVLASLGLGVRRGTAWKRGVGYGGTADKQSREAVRQKAKAAHEADAGFVQQLSMQLPYIVTLLESVVHNFPCVQKGTDTQDFPTETQLWLALQGTIITSALPRCFDQGLRAVSVFTMDHNEATLACRILDCIRAISSHTLLACALSPTTCIRQTLLNKMELTDASRLHRSGSDLVKVLRVLVKQGQVLTAQKETMEAVKRSSKSSGAVVVAEPALKHPKKSASSTSTSSADEPVIGTESSDATDLSDVQKLLLGTTQQVDVVAQLEPALTTLISIMDTMPHQITQPDAPLCPAEAYVAALQPLAYKTIKFNIHTFCFATQLAKSSARHRMKRIARELSSLSTDLPVNFASSIFLRIDEDRMDVLQALIIGPDDTPYANGCFVFHIHLPDQYPMSPPLVKIVTTDRGKVRFGPNLYADGKVCLSLLGTWSGPSWDPQNSTLLQVLLSIQSMILCDQPLYNEPGFETRKSARESSVYNEAVKFQTARVAMLNMLQHPPSEFVDVIHAHFSTKRQAIIEQLKAWEQSVTSASYPAGQRVHQLMVPTMAQARKTFKDVIKQLGKLSSAPS